MKQISISATVIAWFVIITVLACLVASCGSSKCSAGFCDAYGKVDYVSTESDKV
jgi:hypothetical protein